MKTPQKILVVDDDPNILAVLETRLSAAGFRVLQAGDAASASRILKQTPVDLLVSDVKMPRKSGMELFKEIRETLPDLPVIFLTAYGTIPDAVDAIKLGAVDYISKPFDGRELIEKINQILALCKKEAATARPEGFEGDYYWGESPAMKALFDMVKKVAPTQVNVLLLGESGVGKERIARYIHEHSARKNQACVVVDCGSTPAGILESELFGHVKGAFTHAVKDKTGLIEAADKGTLFLDEIGNISHDMQCRLLRFLEDRQIRQVGSVCETPVDCRVISATNADLMEDIQAGTFRQDLYYRLKGISLTIPPLRERREDIPELAAFFAGSAAKDGEIRFSADAMDLLCTHSWPGNIRELKNVVEVGAILCQNQTIEPRDLQIETLERGGAEAPGTAFSIEESEKNTIIRALKETRGVQKKAADLLNISKRAIHYKVKKYKIDPGLYR
ncbi:sigma-54-dependent transcriptional regulator [Desulfospira joergensenii]|uniref:sigma-54-dependent transcriptional regulator n=1 Tax=Desulfospira joergensenii TaxID=53329 RepID=UPI0003B3E4E2|nr:sigma-54 dependent transcriptional regulator [Desulfospira joergensenii]